MSSGNGDNNSASNSASNSNSNSNSASNSGSGGSSSISIPQTAAVGSVTVTNPPKTATSYYKIADSQLVTFAWSFTDVLVQPTSLTIAAYCSANGNTYYVGPSDGPIGGADTSVVWDIASYNSAHATNKLIAGQYVLSLWGDEGPSATARAGYMNVNAEATFALYTPAGYTGLADGWQCTVCDGALSTGTHPVLIAMLSTFIVMFLSGIHLLRNARGAD